MATIFQAQIDYTLVHRPTYHVARGLTLLKKHILYSFKKKLSKPTFTLFASLFLGEKKINQKEIEILQRQFKQWGILHILARSGLHLVMVLSAYEYIFRFIPLPLPYKIGILLLLNLIYFALSWPSISFIRAFLIFLFYKIFSLLYIPTHFLHILLLICIVILLINPMQLFFIDFQLSFGLTFALGWLNQYKVTQSPS
jgi:competence protein ComEC